MPDVYVQFSDELNTSISSVFSSPQNSDDYPNYDEIDVSDDRYISFCKSLSPIIKQSVTNIE